VCSPPLSSRALPLVRLNRPSNRSLRLRIEAGPVLGRRAPGCAGGPSACLLSIRPTDCHQTGCTTPVATRKSWFGGRLAGRGPFLDTVEAHSWLLGDDDIDFQTATHELLALSNRLDRGNQLACRIGFHHVALCSEPEGFLHDLNGGLLTEKKNFRIRGNLANSSTSFDAIQNGQPNIQQDQIRLKVFGSLNRLDSVFGVANDLELWLELQFGDDKSAIGFKVVDEKYSESRHRVEALNTLIPFSSQRRMSAPRLISNVFTQVFPQTSVVSIHSVVP
jgi:hypothetical protein